ncbi:LytTR family transcriptional regulator DNA-binding domain-containing protein [Zhouia spongiae]|uniref:LytTR family transcriptional regulator DNA-binding domain-containing protein n=1 Tax=Zhouia spongiae TaxID=2202721 RepID=A0ABY3YKC8_9FLAO|nr:LytTR family transcriptional regulator DNA-binding domain-containing protein [Zhouia spongiae]UNY98295.1 LytTR family transcriptional regulator DNA-binding domain-containing protein [Zhouia spongiae]
MKSYVIIEKDKKVSAVIQSVCSEEGFESYGCFDNYEDGLDAMLQHSPDVVFMDVDSSDDQLKEFLLDLSDCLEKLPALIGLTDTKDKGYFAIKNNFTDLLLKPIKILTVRRCLAKYNKRFSSLQSGVICLRSNKDFNYLNTADILFLKADNNTTDIYLEDNSVIHSYNTLKVFEDRLPENFKRVHKSYIINSDFVSRIHYGKKICLIRKGAYKVPFTRTFVHNVDTINSTYSDNSILTLN